MNNKRLILLLVTVFCAFFTEAQITGTYQIKGADTVKIFKVGGTTNPNATELVLKNSSDTVLGFLFNTGLGITKFKRALVQLSSNTWLVGNDTLRVVGMGGSTVPGGPLTSVQLNIAGAFFGYSNLTYDPVGNNLNSGGLNNTFNVGTLYGAVIGQLNTLTNPYAYAFGNSNTVGLYSVASGQNNTVNAYSISVGQNNGNTANSSATFGSGLLNIYQNALVVGQFNDTTAWAGAATAISIAGYPVFSIGNGSSSVARGNAFTVLHNGTIITALRNNITLDSVLMVDASGVVRQTKIVTGGGGSGINSITLTMPGGFTVTPANLSANGTFAVTTPLTNGVAHVVGGAFTSSLIVDADVNNVNWNKITNTPTTVTGYGIINAVRSDIPLVNPFYITSLPWSKITATPTTLAGYGITDPVVVTTGSYSNPSFITSLAWSKITSTPTTLAGYGITDNIVLSVNGLTGNVVSKNADSIKHLPVDTSAHFNNFVVTFDSINHKFFLGPGGTGGGTNLFSSLLDVSVVTPVTGQIPVYNAGTGKWTNTAISTTIVAEGTNLYWTNARFDTRFHTKTTDSLTEGTTNLYFTNTRARAAISATSPLGYSAVTGVMSIQVANAGQGGYIDATDWNTILGNKNKNLVFASDPTTNGVQGIFRALTVNDLPNLGVANIYAINGITAVNDSTIRAGGGLTQATVFHGAQSVTFDSLTSFNFTNASLGSRATLAGTDSVLIKDAAGRIWVTPQSNLGTGGSGSGGKDTTVNITVTGGLTSFSDAQFINTSLVDLFINGVRIPTISSATTWVSFNAVTGTLTLTNGTWHTGDDVAVEYFKGGSTAVLLSSLTDVSTGGATDGQLIHYVAGTNKWTNFTSPYVTGVTLTGPVTGTTTGAGVISVATTVGANAITNAMLAQMAAHTRKGNITGSTANATDVTSTQETADLNQFTSSMQGMVSPSGGGTLNFLRADNTWAVPVGFANPLTTNNDIIAQLAGVTTRLPGPAHNGMKLTGVGGGLAWLDSTASAGSITGTRFFAPVGAFPNQEVFHHAQTSAANKVQVVKFFIPYSIALTKFRVFVSDAVIGETCNVGIYDTLGNKIIASPTISLSTSTTVTSTVAQTIISAGFYWLAYSTTNTTANIQGFSNPGDADFSDNTFIGEAANSTSAGVMPTTLGAITGSLGNDGPLVTILH